jgi:hypothetical protein
MYMSHDVNKDFSPLTNGVYFIVSIRKTPLHNGNIPIEDRITKMRVADAF